MAMETARGLTCKQGQGHGWGKWKVLKEGFRNIHRLQPAPGWRMLTMEEAANGSPDTKGSFFTSLGNHLFFTISCFTLIGSFFVGYPREQLHRQLYQFNVKQY